jgi:hypothetical protein
MSPILGLNECNLIFQAEFRVTKLENFKRYYIASIYRYFIGTLSGAAIADRLSHPDHPM